MDQHYVSVVRAPYCTPAVTKPLWTGTSTKGNAHTLSHLSFPHLKVHVDDENELERPIV